MAVANPGRLRKLSKIRETTEEWPLLTVEIEMNGNSKNTSERSPSLGWFFGLVVPTQEIFVLLWLL